jgi:hypothetical protein
MKYSLMATAALFVLSFTPRVAAQTHGKGYIRARVEVAGTDTIQVLDALPLYVFKRPADLRKYQKLIYNLKKVYPIAKHARYLLAQTEANMEMLPDDRERRKYIKQFEEELKKTYTPVFKKMTFSQGKLLIKLVDRETEKTTYTLVRELRGSFSAFFWQGIARIFGADLKDTYDRSGEDRVIEQLILYYEAGLL